MPAASAGQPASTLASESAHGAFYFIFTGLHAGIWSHGLRPLGRRMCACLRLCTRRGRTANVRRVNLAAIYWHFMARRCGSTFCRRPLPALIGRLNEVSQAMTAVAPTASQELPANVAGLRCRRAGASSCCGLFIVTDGPPLLGLPGELHASAKIWPATRAGRTQDAGVQR